MRRPSRSTRPIWQRAVALASSTALLAGCADMPGWGSPLPRIPGRATVLVGSERPAPEPRAWTIREWPDEPATRVQRLSSPWLSYTAISGLHLLEIDPAARYLVRIPGIEKTVYVGTIGADGAVRDEREAAQRFVAANSRLGAAAIALATPYPPQLSASERALAASATVRFDTRMETQALRWLAATRPPAPRPSVPVGPDQMRPGPVGDGGAERTGDGSGPYPSALGSLGEAGAAVILMPFVLPFALGAIGATYAVVEMSRYVQEERRFAGTGPEGGPGVMPSREAADQCLERVVQTFRREEPPTFPREEPAPQETPVAPRPRRAASPPANPWTAHVTRLAIRRCGAAPFGLGVEVATRWSRDDGPAVYYFGRPVRFVRSEGPPGTQEPQRPWELSAGPEAPCRQVVAYCGPDGTTRLQQDVDAAIAAAREAIRTGR